MKKAGWSSILVAAMLLAVAVIAEAQQPKKIPRIGYLEWSLPFRSRGPHRGVPAGTARAWLRGGEKHRH